MEETEQQGATAPLRSQIGQVPQLLPDQLARRLNIADPLLMGAPSTTTRLQQRLFCEVGYLLQRHLFVHSRLLGASGSSCSKEHHIHLPGILRHLYFMAAATARAAPAVMKPDPAAMLTGT
eukprot:GHRR01033771.1.p2 GENE.GHRR01033771.1~~GHRR01033771.1.p2  ORF type:complete len:121 (-),score=30.81 GHRR01033771.1:1051-1413(-)